mgnify:CR=1 FL=1
MSAPPYRVRRATLDDIAALVELWRSMRFPAEELARRVTEFQVAEQDGRLVGAVALQMAERQGRIHSEAFTDFALADSLRPMLWERIHSLATNHGLLRLWTQEQAPFWSHSGLSTASPEHLAKLPTAWRELAGTWRTLQLREDLETIVAADKEFALFMEAEKQRTQRAFQQARVLKLVATLVALALLAAVMVGAIYVLRHGPLVGR